MTDVVLDQVDLSAVENVVGTRSYQRGAAFAPERVLRMGWDDTIDALSGLVLGNGGIYEADAQFVRDRSGRLQFVEGDCTCPVGYDCKHVAALVLAAAGVHRNDPAPTLRHVDRPPPEEPVTPPAWERSFGALLGEPQDARARGDAAPLAIELALDPDAAARGARLTARIMRPGRHDWVNGGLSWGALDRWRIGSRSRDEYVAEHIALLRELDALHAVHAANRRPAYYSGGDKVIDVAAFSEGLWPLLDRARRIGLRFLHADRTLGDVETGRRAELCLDLTGADTDTTTGIRGLTATPELRVEGLDIEVEAVGFLGATGHGVVYTSRADAAAGADPSARRFGLARLDKPAPEALRKLVRSGEAIEIPHGDRRRFTGEVWPRLRLLATVTSSDGSFVEPEITGPRLVLRATYGLGHVVDLTWAWAYDLDGTERRCEIRDDATVTGYRDAAAELDLIASLPGAVGELGLLDDAGPRPHVQLTGLDTMRFATEVLPLLDETAGVVVESSGRPAEFREVTDSVTIGLSTDDVAGETDWFDLGVTITVDGQELPFAGVFSALASGESHLLLGDGAYFSLEKPQLQSLRALIGEARALQDQPPDGLRISRYQVGFWDELCQLGVVTRQAEAWERQVGGLRALTDLDPGAHPVEVPADVNAQLRPYQRDGFGWLAFLWEHGLGGVLADDMGLGKTLQTLALICHARRSDEATPPFLVVAPTSVVANWAAEAARFAPGLAVTAVTDTFGRSGRTLDDVTTGADVVVTSYTLLRLDADTYEAGEWAGLVLDEAQHAKNHRSKIYGCIRRFPAPFKLAVTGTPMENNLMELWSLLSITAPGLFGDPKRFAEHYAKPIERGGDAETLARLRRRIKPLVLRRTKELVAADLPAKQAQVLDIELSPRHRKLYDTRLHRERQKVLGLLDDLDRNRITILRSLTLLRQLSLHPALVDDTAAAAKVPCAKLDTLADHVREVIDGGHRALVFSQFTRFLSLVRDRLDAEGVEYCYLDGGTTRRAEVVRRFKEGTAPAFLISLKAGGVGLNLTEADYCFLLDPWWNPATETQAVDRIHRIGQTRNVMVYRLIAAGTIEEKVMALNARKAELFAGVMDEGGIFDGRLDADDIRALLA